MDDVARDEAAGLRWDPAFVAHACEEEARQEEQERVGGAAEQSTQQTLVQLCGILFRITGIPDERPDLLCRLWSMEQISLHQGATAVLDDAELLRSLNALGRGGHAKCSGKNDNRRQDGAGFV